MPRSEPLGEDAPLRAAIQQAERQYILRVLSSVDGNRQRAAEVLGISTVTLWRKLQEGGA